MLSYCVYLQLSLHSALYSRHQVPDSMDAVFGIGLGLSDRMHSDAFCVCGKGVSSL